MNLFDVIVLVILGIALYTGFKRGLRSFFSSLLSLVLGIISAYVFYRPVAGLVERQFKLLETISSYIRTKINPTLAIMPASLLKEKIVTFLKSLTIPASTVESIKKIVDNLKIPHNQTIGQFLPNALAKVILVTISYIFVFIVAYLLFKILLHWVIKGEETNPKLRRIGAIGNFTLVFLIIFYLLSAYETLGLSIFIPNHYIVNLINNSFSLRIALLLHPLFSFFAKLLGGM